MRTLLPAPRRNSPPREERVTKTDLGGIPTKISSACLACKERKTKVRSAAEGKINGHLMALLSHHLLHRDCSALGHNRARNALRSAPNVSSISRPMRDERSTDLAPARSLHDNATSSFGYWRRFAMGSRTRSTNLYSFVEVTRPGINW